jgi:hypothetical protein
LWDVVIDWGNGPFWVRRIVDGEAIARISEESRPKGSQILRAHMSVSLNTSRVALLVNAVARLGWAMYIAPGKIVAAQAPSKASAE